MVHKAIRCSESPAIIYPMVTLPTSTYICCAAAPSPLYIWNTSELCTGRGAQAKSSRPCAFGSCQEQCASAPHSSVTWLSPLLFWCLSATLCSPTPDTDPYLSCAKRQSSSFRLPDARSPAMHIPPGTDLSRSDSSLPLSPRRLVVGSVYHAARARSPCHTKYKDVTTYA